MSTEVNQSDTSSAPSSAPKEEEVYDDGYLHVEHQRFYVTFAGRPLYDLTRKEFFILSRLARQFGRAVHAEEVWQAAWGDGVTANLRTLRVHVATLRRKLAPFGLDVPAVVHTGYRLIRTTPSAPLATDTIEVSNETTNHQDKRG